MAGNAVQAAEPMELGLGDGDSELRGEDGIALRKIDELVQKALGNDLKTASKSSENAVSNSSWELSGLQLLRTDFWKFPTANLTVFSHFWPKGES